MTDPSQELRRLLVAQVPADFADWLDFVAIGALLAFTWQVEPYVFALLAVSMGLPYLAVGPVAGVFVDRSDTRSVLIWSNVGRGIVTASFFLASDWPLLLALIALRSAIDTFFTPAKQSAIQALTDRDRRTRANAISHGINQSSKIVAPTVGGVLLIWMSPHLVFLINAGVSVIAASLLMRLRSMRSETTIEEQASALSAIRGGLKMMADIMVLRAAIGMMAAGFFAMFFYDTLIAPLTRDLSFSQTHLGFALAAVGAGGVLGAAILAMIGEMKRPFLSVALGAGIGGATVIALGLAEATAQPIALLLFIAAFFVLGIGSAMSVVPFRTIIQNNTDERSIGQITALSEATNTMALLTAPFIGAWIASLFSTGAAFILGGLVMLAVTFGAVSLRNQN